MIKDRLENCGIYYGLGERIAKGLALLNDEAVRNSAPGRYEVDGEDMYYNFDSYETMPAGQGRFEAHRRYIDIQYIVSGREWIGVREIEGLRVQAGYDAKKDIEFYYSAEPMSRVVLGAGDFAIFRPGDAHMPCRMFDKPERVRKIVVKVGVK